MTGLKVVPSRLESIDFDRIPGLFVLGPLKTGTTWLAEHLNSREDMSYGSIKESGYFTSLGSFGWVPDELKPFDRDISWYTALFPPRNETLLTFDATANYAAAVDEDVASDILTLSTDARFIICVRNPIDRALSHLKHWLRHQDRPFAEIDRSEVIAFLNGRDCLRSSDYRAMISDWSEWVGRDRIHLASFATMAYNPVAYLGQIEDFLGVPNVEYRDLDRVMNRGHVEDFPPFVIDTVVALHAESVDWLGDNGFPADAQT